MKKNLLLIVLLMALIPWTGYSQNKAKKLTVAGIVVDEAGEPLIGTTIFVKNEAGTGTAADIDG